MKRFYFVILAIVFLTAPALSQAAQFAVVGPRALGMGGASVAAVNDSTAVYWNPAALADLKKFEIHVPASVGFHDHMDLKDNWDRINNINALVQAYDPTAINEMISLFNDLNKPNTGTDLDLSGGLLVSIPFSKSAIAVSALGLGYAGLYPTIDTLHSDSNPYTVFPTLNPNFVGNNNSAVTGIGVFTVEPAVSFATSLGETLFIGANAKMIYASTFVHTVSMRTNDYSNFISNLNNSETKSNKGSVDAGILFAPTKSFSIGVVGRDLNSPSFPIQGVYAQKSGSNVTTVTRSDEVKLDPQVRAGIAWKPFSHITVSADYDISKNKTLTPGFEDQTAAAGVEITLPKEIFSIRGGAYKNLADSNSNMVYTAGFGIRAFVLRVDIAGAYDFDNREYQGSVDLALRF